MKILIAEDDPSFRKLLEDKLAMWGYEVVATENGRAALQVLHSDDPPRIAVLDWIMPEMDGIEVCRKVREVMSEPYTYILLLTSQRRDEDLIAGMEAGADDYLTKPFKHTELKLRLRAGRRIIELQNELIAARESFRTKASHDSLTGLLNHGEILNTLKLELSRAERVGDYVSVIMTDVDFFKKINDKYGHLVGDEVLRLTSDKMQHILRSYDHIGRYGGEEFLIVLPECCPECAASFAERLRICIAKDKIDTAEGMIPVSISLGVASSGNSGMRDAETLIKAADAALYRAKENGRNRVEIALGVS